MERVYILSHYQDDMVDNDWIIHCLNATNVLTNRDNYTGAYYIYSEDFYETCAIY